MEGECAERNFVGDWLVGMCTRVGEEFSLADATADHKKMVTDFDEGGLSRARLHGPGRRTASPELGRFRGFECMPTYQPEKHLPLITMPPSFAPPRPFKPPLSPR